MLGQTELTVIDGTARIACRHLSDVLGFARIGNLHAVIERHKDELEDFGEVFLRVQKNPSARGGRPIKSYFLNEHQATAVCLWAETPKARAARRLIVEVFTAWRLGQLESCQPPVESDPFEHLAARSAHVSRQMVALHGLPDVVHGITHLPIWSNGHRPLWWNNIPVREFLIMNHRQMTLAQCLDELERRFGYGITSVKSINRFWMRLDKAFGPALQKRKVA